MPVHHVCRRRIRNRIPEGHDALRQRFRRASRRNRTITEFHPTGRTNKIMRRHGGMFRQTNDHATHSEVQLRRSPWAMKMVGSGARPSRLSPTNPKQDSRLKFACARLCPVRDGARRESKPGGTRTFSRRITTDSSRRTRSMIGRLHTVRPVRNARLSRDGARRHMKSWMLSARRFSGLPVARSHRRRRSGLVRSKIRRPRGSNESEVARVAMLDDSTCRS